MDNIDLIAKARELRERNASALWPDLNGYRTLVPQLCDALEEVEAKNRWIPVGERLPEKDETVLLLSQGAVKYGHLFLHRNGRTIFVASAVEVPRVTHWMPLPEPPKGE